jgi:hypothetical protein
MHVGIDEPRKGQQSTAVRDLSGVLRRQRATDGRDFSAGNPDVAAFDRVLAGTDDSNIPDDQVVASVHWHA